MAEERTRYNQGDSFYLFIAPLFFKLTVFWGRQIDEDGSK